MEQTPAWETNARSSPSCREILLILWNQKIYYCIHRSPQLALIVSQINSVHTLSSYLLKIHFNIYSHLRVGLHSGFFPSGFPTKNLYMPHLLPTSALCPVRLILIDFYHFNDIWWRVQIVNLLSMPSIRCYFVPLRPK